MSDKAIDHGTGVLVWWHDGKIKFRTFSSEDALADEVKRLKGIVPPTNMYLGVIDWDECTLESFLGVETVEDFKQ